MKKTYHNFKGLARKLLFEDSYPRYTTQDFRAGTQFTDESLPVGEESNPMEDLPIEINPQMSTQLSTDAPPVDDPDFEPANSKELASALQVLAQKLPDRLAGSVYRKFEEYVSNNSGEDLPVTQDEVGEYTEEDEERAEEIAEKLMVFKRMLEG